MFRAPEAEKRKQIEVPSLEQQKEGPRGHRVDKDK